MEHWRLILCGYIAVAILAALFFLLKIIKIRKKFPVKTETGKQQLRLLVRFIQSLTVIFAVMAVHISYLCGDINLCCPVITVLALLFIAVSLCA